MKLLAIDSSGMTASVAVLEDGVLIGEYTINHKKTHSQTLLPMIDEVVRMTETELSDITAIAVAAGPGSFTGLRIGSATAKGLGLALDKPIISVPTLEGLAYNVYGCDDMICPMMDARRKQVYTAVYEFTDDGIRTVIGQKACPVTEILQEVEAMGRPVLFLGDGVPVSEEAIRETITAPYELAPAHMNLQRAASVALCGADRLKAGLVERADEHKPIYLRKSQAERELEAKGKRIDDLIS